MLSSQQRETLFDRFQPFKPYDLVILLIMCVLVAPQSDLTPTMRILVFGTAIVLFCLLYSLQRFIFLPPPTWLMLFIVVANTSLVAMLLYLDGTQRYELAFSILNVTFSTLAFGQQAGIMTAVLTAVMLAQIDTMTGEPSKPLSEWALFLAVLLTVVALLQRITKLQQHALYDAVTGLHNHRFFQVRLREEFHRATRSKRPLALILIDVDNFKEVNDQLGHAVGDRFLRQFGEAISQQVRKSDVVCRYGGDEIAIILPETTVEEAMHIAERCRAGLAASRALNIPVTVAFSAGVAVFPTHAETVQQLIDAADRALYSAKDAGKNRVAVATGMQNAIVGTGK
ncbi:MAG: hypothetical protein KatS3mg105_0422 [Gemmatales bacterium]|nr:MAG: hypothetical protein KatS3mg105_0422 [Gemmatales bacterium]